MKNNPKTLNRKRKGLSPIVLLLFCFAIIIIIVCISMKPADKKANEHSDIPDSNDQIQVDNEDIAPDDETTKLPNNVHTEDSYLKIESQVIDFPSGGFVSFGYPSIILKDSKLSEKINTSLKDLVNSEILPKAQELAAQDTPGSERSYDYILSVSEEFYSIIVTVDIKEGITSDLQIFAWNFFKTSGEMLNLERHCSDRYSLSKLIDSYIKNTAAYDTLIHEWLTSALVSEKTNDNFSFYLNEDKFVAVINKRFRLNSPDRSPILIEVPYEQIKSYLAMT